MVDFGDKRLDRRFLTFRAAMVRQCSVILRKLAKDRSEEIGFGRFLRHPKVTSPKILGSNYWQTNQESRGKHVLLIQDTSTLGFGLSPRAGKLGPIGDNKSRGIYLHPVLALDAKQGTCLGLASTQFYQRKEYQEQEELSKFKARKAARRKRPFEQKESYRWWTSAKTAVQNTAYANQHTVIADSESDIFDLMVNLEESNTDFILRNYHNRTLNFCRSGYQLEDHLRKQKVQCSYEVDLPATDERSAHLAQLNVKWSSVNLTKPNDTPNKQLPDTLSLTVVEVKEDANSVVNKEQPIHWRLLTSHKVKNKEQALQIIKWYTWRWVIEEFFRSLKKKGLNIQSAQVESPESLTNLIAMSLNSSVEIMQLVQARKGDNDLNMDLVFTEKEIQFIQHLNLKLEGRTKKLKNPHDTDSLAFAAWVVARLGGWSGYQSQRPPGPITMANGLRRLRDAIFISNLDP